MCCLLAMVLVMVDLTRHILNDAYARKCFDVPEHEVLVLDGKTLDKKYSVYCYPLSFLSEYYTDSNGKEHLSALGWISTIFCTYGGFILLFIGIFWSINFVEKIRAQWAVIRARRGDVRQPLTQA